MTRATFAGLLGSLLVFLALAVPARADQRAPQAYAVLVGVSRYDDTHIQTRPFAEEDVKALYDVLTDKAVLGLDKEHVRLLLGKPDDKRGSQPATRGNILTAAKWLADKAGKDDLVFFVFVGQGAAFGERADRVGYFGVDAQVKDIVKTSATADALAEQLDRLQSHRFCALVDVSLRGHTLPNNAPAREPTVGDSFYKEFLGDDGDDDGGAAPGRVLYLATSGRLASPDVDKHGAFLKTVVDGLKGKADREGYEPDGVVTVDELTAHLRSELTPILNKHGSGNDRPRHLVLTGEDANFVLVHNPTAAAKAKERLTKFEALVKENKKLTPEIAQQGKDFLTRMPKLEAFRGLRKDYQKLADGELKVDDFLAKRDAVLEGTKLTRRAAQEYAETVMDAIAKVKSVYVKEVKTHDMVTWAIRELYKRAGVPVPEAIQKSLGDAKELSQRDLHKLLVDARTALGKREDLDKHKDVDQTLFYMLKHLDPYTTYYDPESLEREKGQIQGRFIGVGIQIAKDANTDYLKVITPIYGSPAFEAKIQAGDLITTITREVGNDGKKLDKPEVLSTKGLSTDDAVKKIKGLPRTPVTLTIQRPGEDKTRDVTLVRKEVSTETVLGSKRKDDATWDYWVDPTSKIGYIRLTQFTRTSYPDMFKVMANLKKEGVKGLVLDLRFNPGGLLDSARDISDLFIDDGKIVSIRQRGVPEYTMSGYSEGSHLGFPMVCLINELSASGSEIVAACLQDHHRALVIGERSYGKGSVQNVLDFEKDGKGEATSQIKLTTATYWRPSGRNINKSDTKGKPDEDWGVRPDREVKLSRDERASLFEHQKNVEIIAPKDKPPSTEDKVEAKDKQLDAALEYLRGQMKLAQMAPTKKAG